MLQMPTNKMVKVHHNLVEPQEESLAPGKTAVTQGPPAPVETLAVLQESPAPFEMVVTQGSPAPVETPAVLQESPAPFEMVVTRVISTCRDNQDKTEEAMWQPKRWPE